MAFELFRVLGSIIIDDKDAIDSLKKTDKKAKESKEALQKISDTGKAIGKAVLVGTTAAIAAVGAMTASFIDSTGTISDNSKKVGMSAEEYQQWSYAAKLSGVEQEKLTALMVKQQKSFSDATEGSKTASDAYRRLGIDIKGLSSGQAFNKVMAALASTTNETERNALANDIFGKSYADLAPLLEEGADGMDNLKQEAIDLGGVMSNDTVAAGEELGDNIDRLKTGFQGVVNTLIESLMPTISSLIDWILANKDTIGSIFKGVFDVLASAIQFVSDNANWLLPILAALLGGIIAFQVVTTISSIIGILTTALGASTVATIGFNAALLANPITWIVLAVVALIAIIVALAMNFDKVKETAMNLWNGIKSVFGSIGNYIGSVANGIANSFWSVVDKVRNAFENVKNAIMNPVETAKNVVAGIVEKIKGFFNFDWSLPKLKMPHFSVSGSANPIDWLSKGLPKISVDWYAKGGIFTEPTIFGTNSGWKGVGEKGPEAILPINKLPELLDLDSNGIDEATINRLITVFRSTLLEVMSGWGIYVDEREFGKLSRKVSV